MSIPRESLFQRHADGSRPYHSTHAIAADGGGLHRVPTCYDPRRQRVTVIARGCFANTVSRLLQGV